MNQINEIFSNKSLHEKVSVFLSAYGISGLEQALQLYTDLQQEYICKTKTSITRLKISDIYYLEVHQHNISVHTKHGIYHKYGTLSNELNFLSKYNFIKCSQNYVVSLSKIQSITGNQLTLNNNETLHLSRSCATTVMMAFHNSKSL